jgi:anti-sigma-K factor RskA
MKKMNEKKMDALLSQYVDGILSEQDVKLVESFLAADASVRKKIAELKRLKLLLSSQPKLNPDIGFWTRLSVAMEEQKEEENNLLPFPRKFIPAVSVIVTAVVVVAGTFVIQNRMQFAQYLTTKSQAVREVYEKKILQGSLLPLFSKVDKDRALQFSLFGTLPLDDKSETALRVDEQSEKGYRIEVGNNLNSNTKAVTFNRFVAEVKPSTKQKKIIDSLLELTGRRIESSVLIGENNTMAIAPDLPKLNRLMVANIASCLEPAQRVNFERLLKANNAPYTVTMENIPVGTARNYIQHIPKFPQGDRFVIITPDTMLYSQIHIDFDSLRRQVEENFANTEVRRDAILKKILAREFRHMENNVQIPTPDQIFDGGDFFSMEINVPGGEDNQQQMHVVVQPRFRKQLPTPKFSNHSTHMRIGKDTVSSDIKP